MLLCALFVPCAFAEENIDGPAANVVGVVPETNGDVGIAEEPGGTVDMAPRQIAAQDVAASNAVDVAAELNGDVGTAEERGSGALPEGGEPEQLAPATVGSDDVALVAADESEDSYEDGHVNMYRLYNPNSGEHFYTADIDEATSVASVGWRWEGIGWVAPAANNLPVYRLYNPNAGDHHYTLNLEEKDWLVGLGWRYEGIGWYSDAEDQLSVYRQYNPNAVAGAHNFTTDPSEDEYLGSVGWSREGISWRATNGPTIAIAGRWLVTAAWGTTERYWIDSTGNIAKWRLIATDEGAGYDAYATGSGAVVRGKYDRGDGYVYVADNDGRLAATSDGADGWLVTDAYDGGLQRYYYVAAERAMRSGFFTVGDGKYFGLGGEGYIARGKTPWGDYVLLADNDGLMAVGTGWLVTDVYDGGYQRYYLEYAWSDYSGARTGLFEVEGVRYYGMLRVGYVARNRCLYADGQWYKADNDGALAIADMLEVKDVFLHILSSADPSSHLTLLGDAPYSFASASGARLANAVNNLRWSGSAVSFVMMDLTTGYGIASSPHDVFYSASTIKGPYVAAINHFAPGSVGGYESSLMYDTIMYSSNEDYAALRSMYGGGVMQNQLDYCDVHSIDAGSWYVYYSPVDLAKLWVGNYMYFTYDSNENSAWCRSLYTGGRGWRRRIHP